MEVNSLTINKIFSSGGDVQYILPYFQREYSWEKSNWNTLINDVVAICENNDDDEPPEHFLGAIVVIDDGTRNGTMPAFKLVDGQQRLTTISILLCSLANHVDATSPLFRKIQKLLLNPDEKDLLRYKVLPTEKNGDRQAYISLLDSKPIPLVDSRIPEVYHYFTKQLSARIDSGLDPNILFKVIIQNIHAVFINLNHRERPYEIFESLNAKGKPLTQPDLVRNYVAMRLPASKQSEVFSNHWVKIETMLKENRTVSRIGELTAFLRHYLAFRLGALPNKEHVYARFRDRVESKFETSAEFIDEIQDLHRFAVYYDRLIRPDNEPNNLIRKALKRLNVLEVFTAYPFLLYVYDLLDTGLISLDEFIKILETLENYMVRRFLASEPTAYVNKMFPALRRDLDESDFVNSLHSALINRKYPSDTRLRQSLENQPIYDKRRPQRLVLVMETINKFLSKGTGGFTTLDNSATIEHILPQTMSEEWKAHIGSNWNEVHREYLHTIGNLTLVTQEWNSTLSNSSYSRKRKLLSEHALLLNREYFGEATLKWNEDSIRSRSKFLANHIINIWSSIGEPPKSLDVTGTKPTSLLILGEAFEVKTWRDVAIQIAETTSELAEDFDAIANEMGAFFDEDDNWNSSRQLSNGWYLNVHLSAKDIVSFCERLTAIVGLSNDDWEFTNE